MAGRKSKASEDIENLCPTSKKRFKTGPASPWKLGKGETASSPSSLNADLLEEMGVVMLDSEESSSSVASALALAASSEHNTDDNSNEITPNLDAMKFRHQNRVLSFRNGENFFDDVNDNGNITGSELDSTLTADNCNTVYSDEIPIPPQHKKVAILGAGAGVVLPANGRNTRSPLATVACNSQQEQSSAGQFLVPRTAARVMPLPVSPSVPRPLSPCLPSTSQQAAVRGKPVEQVKVQKRPHVAKDSPQQQQISLLLNDEGYFFELRQTMLNQAQQNAKDNFMLLSDEIILQIFQWLPKKSLMRCTRVCRRFNRCATDESLWSRLDLGGRSMRSGALEVVLSRGIIILRLAQAKLATPVLTSQFLTQDGEQFKSKLQYLDLSMASITKPCLKKLLSVCRHLKKLSLEHVAVNDEICNEIAANRNLEALNLTMCEGLKAWTVRRMIEALQNLTSLNISWTNLSPDAVTALVSNVTPNLLRLNVAGCRKTMFDSHVATLVKRCPQLLELDLSDCTGLTGNAIGVICKFKMLEYLSLSRCYLIPAASYFELKELKTLMYLDVFGMLSDAAMDTLKRTFPNIGMNKFVHSSVARPTVGTRRTSIWGLRTRD